MERAEFVACIGKETNAQNIFGKKPEKQIPVWSWKANNKADHREIENEWVEWSGLTRDKATVREWTL